MKNNKNYLLAAFLAEHIEKENIVSELFKLFDIDCLERCHFEPSVLDSLINRFNENAECDISVLEEFIEFIKFKQKDIKNKENELIKTIQSYVDDTFVQDISIERIASDLNISYFYMCHIFRDKFNTSINTYRTKKRLEKAMRMLVESGRRISDIAISCGYNNISYFTEIFTKYIGISPTAFREQNADIYFHQFYSYDDMLLAVKMGGIQFLNEDIKTINQNLQSVSVRIPDNDFRFFA